MKMKEMNVVDRPRERLAEKGAAALSDAELIAVLLRTGGAGKNVVELSCELLALAGSLTGLSSMPSEKMRELRGIGSDKAVTISAAFEIGRRFALEKAPVSKVAITSSRQIFDMFHPLMKGLDHEECWAVFLNRANYVISKERLSVGGGSSTTFEPGVIVRKALEKKACGLIVVHNHPSGNPYPGNADRRQTEALKKAAATLDISLLDHIVMADGSYFSFADERLVTR